MLYDCWERRPRLRVAANQASAGHPRCPCGRSAVLGALTHTCRRAADLRSRAPAAEIDDRPAIYTIPSE